MLVGILGGTFNPIHLGHLLIAEGARVELKLDEVIFIPSLIPPHKPDTGLIPSEHRYAMVVLATQDNPHFTVSAIEVERPGRSYSIDTLKRLRSERPRDKFVFIIGSDSLRELGAWKGVDELFKLSRFAVAPRRGYEIKKIPEGVQTVHTPLIDISSSEIKKKLREGRSVRYLVPERVRGYIAKHALYSALNKELG